MWSIIAVKSMLQAFPAGLLYSCVVYCFGFEGTGLGGVLVFLIMLTCCLLACLFFLRSWAVVVVNSFEGDPAVSAVVLFLLAPRAFQLALVFWGGLEFPFNNMLRFGDYVPNCFDCLDCC